MSRIKISRSIAEGIERSITLAKVLEINHPVITFYKGILKEADRNEEQYGTRMSLKIFKYWYNIAVRTVMIEPLNEKPPVFTRLSKRGSPQVMKSIVRYLELKSTCINEKRMILTALRSFELVILPAKPDLSTIVSDSTGPENFRKWQKHFEGFLETNNFTCMVKQDFNHNVNRSVSDKEIKFHYTTKSGISGSSLGTAAIQSLYFKDKPDFTGILDSMSKVFFPKEGLSQIIEDNQNFIIEFSLDLKEPKNIDLILDYSGRLGFIPEKGGKTRCVAIGNYWIQNTLKPLHSCMFETLRHIAMDGTYDQTSQSSRVAKATTEGPVWSYDLTAATDRLPLNIQESVMIFLNDKIGNLWSKILRELKFVYKDKEVLYKVGQPMGFYSSWASLALTHHFIVQYCASQVGHKGPFLKYSILGDDVAIWDERTAKLYEEIIYNLGVDISIAKSYIPKNNNVPWKAEFAKRHFIGGEEVSGIGASVLKEGFREFWCIPEFFTFLLKHGILDLTRTPISKVVRILRLKPQEIQQLACAFHINEILGGPSMTGLPSDAVINAFRSNISTITLLDERMQILMESVSDIWADLFDLEEEDREDLEKIYDTDQVSEQLVIKRVLETRRKEILELQDRMIKFIPSEEWNTPNNLDNSELSSTVKSEDPDEFYQDNILTKLKDIEFVPSIRLSQMLKGIESHTDKKRYRVLFIRRLVKRLMRSISK